MPDHILGVAMLHELQAFVSVKFVVDLFAFGSIGSGVF
jgi:hypothetical protein